MTAAVSHQLRLLGQSLCDMTYVIADQKPLKPLSEANVTLKQFREQHYGKESVAFCWHQVKGESAVYPSSQEGQLYPGVPQVQHC